LKLIGSHDVPVEQWLINLSIRLLLSTFDLNIG